MPQMAPLSWMNLALIYMLVIFYLYAKMAKKSETKSKMNFSIKLKKMEW